MSHAAAVGAASDTSTALGHPRVHLRRTDSTNDRARELAVAGAPHGTLVSASEQTAGRGRQGRRWSAPAGSSVLTSLLLRHNAPTPAALPLQAALAVCDVVGERARIKWPNDIVLEIAPADEGDRDGGGGPRLAKLAGILIEGRPQEGWSVLGIGLNVAVRLHELPAELLADAAEPRVDTAVEPVAQGRLAAATMGLAPSDVEPTLERLLDALTRRLAEPAALTLQQWRERDALLGRQIAWSEGAGRAAGVDEGGRLLVQLPDGRQVALGAGEVHLLAIS